MSKSATIPSPTGTTRLFALLGNPVAQVQAPMILNELFARNEIDALMMALQVQTENLAAVVEGLKRIRNIDGLMITVPHKINICSFADRLGPQSALAGSANALRREEDGKWLAENFDGLGFVAGLRQQGHDPAGRNIVLFGAGGAGAAIASALVHEDIERLTIVDTDITKAETLAIRLGRESVSANAHQGTSHLGAADLVINATPIGLSLDDPLPFSIDDLQDHAVVCDIIMKPAETQLLRAAAGRGLATHPGIHMLTPQIDLYMEFYGVR